MISNATRWDTFEGMMGEDQLPESGEFMAVVSRWCAVSGGRRLRVEGRASMAAGACAQAGGRLSVVGRGAMG